MTRAYFASALLACVVCCTYGVLNDPCNDGLKDCDTGECCAFDHLKAGKSGFLGICKSSLKVGDVCPSDGPTIGQCSCSHGMSCIKLTGAADNICLYLPG